MEAGAIKLTIFVSPAFTKHKYIISHDDISASRPTIETFWAIRGD